MPKTKSVKAEAKALRFTVTGSPSIDGEAEITITTNGVDRSRDRVMPEGGQFATFLKNPVVLFGHDYHSLPVGSCVSLESTEHGIKARWKWLQGDAFADRVRNAWDQGCLRAASIGFMPVKSIWDDTRKGFDFLEWQLLEFSLVPVPANPEAVRALKALGLEPVKDGSSLGDAPPLPSDTTAGDAEEQAELIQYTALRDLLAQIDVLNGKAKALVAGLIADETESPTETPEGEAAEEAVETARLSVLRAYVAQMQGVLCGVEAIAGNCEADAIDEAPLMGLDFSALARLKRGARHSKVDYQLIQEAHDKIVALGAACVKDDGDSEPDTLSLMLADEPEALTLHLEDSDPTLLDFDDAALRETLASVVTHSLSDLITNSVNAALLRASGRVD